MNRFTLAILLVFLTVLPRAAQAKTKLVVWGLQWGKETKALDAQIVEFEKRNPDIEVALLAVGDGAINQQKLMTSAPGGMPPDVINQSDFTTGIQASSDALMPLDDFVAADKDDPDGIHPADYYMAAWQESKYKGHVYSIPGSIDDRMLYYNRKMLRQAGFEQPPQTWEELLEVSKKLTKANKDGTFDHIGFIPNYGNSWLYLYSWQNGGEFMSPDGKICTLNNKYSVEALAFMTKAYDVLGGYDKVSIFQSGFQHGRQDPFILGKIGMVITGNWILDSIARYAPGLDFGVAPAPVPNARLKCEGRFKGQPKFISWSSGFSMSIPRGAQHPQEAWRFIKWRNSLAATRLGSTIQQEYYKSQRRPFVFWLTANMKINEVLQREFPLNGKNFQTTQKAFLDMLPNCKFRPVTPVAATLWDAHERAFETAAHHWNTPQAAMDEQKMMVQKELDKIR